MSEIVPKGQRNIVPHLLKTFKAVRAFKTSLGCIHRLVIRLASLKAVCSQASGPLYSDSSSKMKTRRRNESSLQ